MRRRFEGKLVMVTGAAGGLGRAIALGFGREGAEVALLDVNQEGLKQTATLLADLDARSSTHRVDMGDEAAITAFASGYLGTHDRLDVLINNAGLAYGEISQSFETLTMEKWLRYLAINAVAPLTLAQALRPALAAAKGVVINQSSSASFVPATAYGVTKATLNSMTYGMAQAFGADGIRVNAVAPGIMETEASKGQLSEETYRRVQGMQMLDLHGMPEDIVNLHLFLASEDARFIACEVVRCDAGSRLRGWRN